MRTIDTDVVPSQALADRTRRDDHRDAGATFPAERVRPHRGKRAGQRGRASGWPPSVQPAVGRSGRAAQPAFVKVGMNRYPPPGTVARTAGAGSRSEAWILDAIWGTDFVAESNIVDRHIRSPRIPEDAAAMEGRSSCCRSRPHRE